VPARLLLAVLAGVVVCVQGTHPPQAESIAFDHSVGLQSLTPCSRALQAASSAILHHPMSGTTRQFSNRCLAQSLLVGLVAAALPSTADLIQ
jgi:hypothetical protein